MKKFLLIVLALVVVLIGAAVLVPFLIPVDTYKHQVARQVEQATGRTLTIEGPVELSLVPSFALEAEGVRLANAPGALEPNMLELEAVRVRLRILPLLTGSVEVDRFVLIRPVIHLEVDAEGRPNWQFDTGAPPATGEQAEGAPSAEGGGAPTLPIADLTLGDIRLEDGVVTYTDASSGTTERIEAIEMSLELPNLRSPLAADGSFRYKDKPVELALGVETPLALIQNGASAVTATVTAPELDLSFDGQVQSGVSPGASGGVELDVASIRELAAWLAEPLEFEGEGLRTLAISGQLDATPERVAFADAAISLDDIESTGEFAVDLDGPVPHASGRLDVGALDVNPYLEAPEATEPADAPDAEGDGAETAEEAGASDWSDEPLAIPPIGGVELDFQLTVDSLLYREIQLDRTVVDLTLRDQTFRAELIEFALYDGNGTGSLEVALEDGTPVIRQGFRLQDLKALPFLEAAADLDRLEGTASLELSSETRGVTERQLVENLDGSGNAMFRDGAIVGVNIAAMVRNLATAFLDPDAETTRKTDFAELGGSFTIEDGVVTNDDMRLQAPVLRVEGGGRIDLPARTMTYRIEPKAAPTLEGQGGEQDVAGILVPVIIEGPWDDLSYRPDLSGVLESAVQSREALRQQLERLGQSQETIEQTLESVQSGEQARELLEQLRSPEGAEAVVNQLQEEGPQGLIRGLLSGDGAPSGEAGQAEEQEQPAAESPDDGGQRQPAEAAEDLLRDLFGN